MKDRKKDNSDRHLSFQVDPNPKRFISNEQLEAQRQQLGLTPERFNQILDSIAKKCRGAGQVGGFVRTEDGLYMSTGIEEADNRSSGPERRKSK